MSEKREITDLGRRGFLKIFGATAVGVAVTGPKVAETVGKLIEADNLAVADHFTERPGDELAESITLPADDLAPVPAKDSGLLGIGTRHTIEELIAKDVDETTKHLIMKYQRKRQMGGPAQENEWICIPFKGNIIELFVPTYWAFIAKLYVVQNINHPGGMSAYRNLTTVRLVQSDYGSRYSQALTMANLRHFSEWLRVEVEDGSPIPHEAKALFDTRDALAELNRWTTEET